MLALEFQVFGPGVDVIQGLALNQYKNGFRHKDAFITMER
jgi:hypothetical protein